MRFGSSIWLDSSMMASLKCFSEKMNGLEVIIEVVPTITRVPIIYCLMASSFGQSLMAFSIR